MLHLLDTAGIRESNDKVESFGINKSIETINSADLVIVVLDSSSKLSKEDDEVLKLTDSSNRIIVYNKNDIATNHNDGIFISAKNKDIKPLIDEIYKKFGLSEKAFKTPSLNNTRQLGLLRQANESLLKAKEDALNMFTNFMKNNAIGFFNFYLFLIHDNQTLFGIDIKECHGIRLMI